MQESNAMGALGALGTPQSVDGSKRLRRRSAQAERRRGWLLALLAGACGPAEDDLGGAFAEQGLTIGAGQAERGASTGAYTLFEADPVRPIAVLEKSGPSR
jgi:hypothetical protein